jgi:ABC-type dipeptide/oligopeptide/nickel transport system permease subunit
MTQTLSPAAVAETEVIDPPAPFRRPSAISVVLSKRSTVVCLVIVGIYVLAGLISLFPFMERASSNVVGTFYQPPSFAKPSLWLGTDIQGRSVLIRTIYGSTFALQITFWTSLISLGLGILLGVSSGYFGGWIDALVTWMFTTVSSIPWILLVIAITFVLQGVVFADGDTFKEKFGPLPAIILALGLTDWVGLCRLLRGEVFKHRQADYVQAARAAGASTPRILLRHILPNVFHLVIITFSLAAVGYVQAEVALTFIGIGINDKPSWGRMITDAKQEVLRGVWWQITAATAAIFIICLALNVVGDALRDALDPKLRGRD